MSHRNYQANMLIFINLFNLHDSGCQGGRPFSPITWGIQKEKMGNALALIRETLILILS